jgi:hypothetical protein
MVYTDLLSEKMALDIEMLKLKKELSIKDKKITEQKDRITTLNQGNMELQTKYKYDMKVAKEKQEEFSENYEKCKRTKNEIIDALKARQRGESLTSDQKNTMGDLYHQLEQQLQKEIEKGQIRLKLYRRKVK